MTGWIIFQIAVIFTFLFSRNFPYLKTLTSSLKITVSIWRLHVLRISQELQAALNERNRTIHSGAVSWNKSHVSKHTSDALTMLLILADWPTKLLRIACIKSVSHEYVETSGMMIVAEKKVLQMVLHLLQNHNSYNESAWNGTLKRLSSCKVIFTVEQH